MDKPKILIALYAYYPFTNANTNAMLSYIYELKRKYDVYILTQNKTGMAKIREDIDGIHIIRYPSMSWLRKVVYKQYHIDLKKRRVLYKQALVSVGHIVSIPLYTFIKHPEYLALRKLLKEIDFKFLLSTCESFTSHMNVLEIKKKGLLSIPWFTYFMDPYAYFIGNIGCSTLLYYENQVYQESDLVFTTDEIYEENRTNEHAAHLSKTVPVKFGNFRLIQYPLIKNIFEKGKINCVYVGSLLNESIRSPEYMYKLINGLDDRFCIHMICNNLTPQNIALRDLVLKNSAIVKWYSNLPFEECMGIISHADILLNLGNRSLNQLPSKVFDYIGSGRPIVNFYSLLEDTSMKYLSGYRLKLNIFENMADLQDNLDIFIKFCIANSSQHVKQTEILGEYFEYLPQNVAPVMVNKISEYMEMRKHGYIVDNK